MAHNVLCKEDVPLATYNKLITIWSKRDVMSTIILHMIKRMTFLQLLFEVVLRMYVRSFSK